MLSTDTDTSNLTFGTYSEKCSGRHECKAHECLHFRILFHTKDHSNNSDCITTRQISRENEKLFCNCICWDISVWHNIKIESGSQDYFFKLFLAKPRKLFILFRISALEREGEREGKKWLQAIYFILLRNLTYCSWIKAWIIKKDSIWMECLLNTCLNFVVAVVFLCCCCCMKDNSELLTWLSRFCLSVLKIENLNHQIIDCFQFCRKVLGIKGQCCDQLSNA